MFGTETNRFSDEPSWKRNFTVISYQ